MIVLYSEMNENFMHWNLILYIFDYDRIMIFISTWASQKFLSI